MESTTIWAVISTFIATIGSTQFLSYMQSRRRDKQALLDKEEAKKTSYINDYEARIKKLEDQLEESEEENRKLNTQIIELSRQVAILSTKLEILEVNQKLSRKKERLDE